MESTPAPRRRRWLRFSLRSLVLLSLCAGAAPLLWFKLPVWRLDMIIESTQSMAKLRTYNVGKHLLYEVNAQRITLYRGDREAFAFDFHVTYLAKDVSPQNESWTDWSDRNRLARILSPDLKKLLMTDECHAALYDIENFRLLHEWKLIPETQATLPEFFDEPRAAFSPDGSRIAIACPRREQVVVLNAISGEIVSRAPTGDYVHTISFSSDSSRILIERTRQLDVLDVDATSRMTIDLGNNYYWRGSARLYSPDNDMPRGALVHFAGREGLSFLSLTDRSEMRKIQFNTAEEEFAGFSPDGHFYFASLPHIDRQSKDKTLIVHNSVTGAKYLECKFDHAFEEQGTDSESSSSMSVAGDLCVLSNPAGDVRLWKMGTKEFAGEIRPREMTKRPPVKYGYDGPTVISCMAWQRPARHQVAATATGSCDAIFAQGVHSPRRINSGEIERDYIIRRNHPDEWYGVALMGEFWLAVVFAGLLGWSLVRDWREL